MKIAYKLSLLVLLLLSGQAFGQAWENISAQGNPTPRHENSAVASGNDLYVIGGRGIKPVEVFHTKNNTWEKLAETPIEMHHFQAVAYKGEIYVAGALTGSYPHETPISHVYIFNPQKNEWRKGPEIPRKRGGAGCFVMNDRLYLVCGIVDGHWNGHMTWFDSMDLETGSWALHPDAPRARDHVAVGVIGEKLVVAGGRRSRAKTKEVMTLTESNVDVFDFTTKKWTIAPKEGHIPTLRAGSSAVVYNGKLVVIGGESGAQVPAHNEAEAFDPETMSWTSLPKMNTGRHGTGAGVINGKIYTAAGSKNRGGGPELNSVEVFK